MSRLVEMRQRIKTIQTIKKIIEAMRLASIASHTASKRTIKNLEEYTHFLQKAYTSIGSTHAHPSSQEAPTKIYKSLYILIGSQKGLCGTFNTMLSEYYKNHYRQMPPHEQRDHIIIGKQLQASLPETISIVRTIPHFTLSSLDATIAAIMPFVRDPQYQIKAVVYNYPKTFFNQKPLTTFLTESHQELVSVDTTQEKFFYEPVHDIATAIEPMLLLLQLKTLLIQSINAENAARFIAMDNASRNASDNLTSLKITYNKLRQAEITKEINDLAGSL